MNALDREQQVRRRLRESGRALVAFSAGVDSTYLLHLAFQELGGMCEAVTAVSASLAAHSRDEAEAFCRSHGIAWRAVATDEFAQPAYIANDGQRCFHCKSALMTAMNALASAMPPPRPALLLGVIADDLGDWRPGMRAAEQGGAAFPLAEAGMTKAMVRERSRELGLPTWDRPAEPCLSSRVPYGEPVEPAGLRMIEQAEAALRHLGFEECRARHHRIGGVGGSPVRGHLCRIEVPAARISDLAERHAEIDQALRRIGYAQVAVDLGGLASGGGNRLLAASERLVQRG